jgi:hypothetical protein
MHIKIGLLSKDMIDLPPISPVGVFSYLDKFEEFQNLLKSIVTEQLLSFGRKEISRHIQQHTCPTVYE